MTSRIDISHLDHPPLEDIKKMLEDAKKRGRPPFHGYEPDLETIRRVAKKVDSKNIVIIGHGGSVTTFKGLLGSAGRDLLKERTFHIIDTVDPRYVSNILSRTSPEDTWVIAVSKSGNTLTVLEVLSVFHGYPTIAVTQSGDGTLGKLAVEKGWEMAEVPEEIGGRFSGGTASTLLPAAILGVDVDSYLKGMNEAHDWALKGEEILNLCGAFYMKERWGKRTLFIPVYSKGLSAFNDLVTQLMHETLAKGRKGLTTLCFEGPECQHHTNQRILDGPEDVASLFITVNGNGEEVRWDSDVNFKGRKLSGIGGYDLGKAMESESRGVKGSMDELDVPWAEISLPGEDEENIGFYVGMWHYIAYYSALLRGVNPFDQPAVEKAKEIALDKRLS